MPQTINCPDCGSDRLQEIAYRYTWQPVRGLTADGSGNDYSEFDYGDDVLVVGYSCGSCEWEISGADTELADAFRAAQSAVLVQLEALAETQAQEPAR